MTQRLYLRCVTIQQYSAFQQKPLLSPLARDLSSLHKPALKLLWLQIIVIVCAGGGSIFARQRAVGQAVCPTVGTFRGRHSTHMQTENVINCQ